MPPVHGSVHFRVTSETEKNGDLHLEEKFLARMQLTVKVIASVSRQDFSDRNVS